MSSSSDSPAATLADILDLRPIQVLRHKIRLLYKETQKEREATGQASGSWADANRSELGLMQFPHAMASAFAAIGRLEEAQHSLAQSYLARRDDEIAKGKRYQYAIGRVEALPLGFAVDNYLESAVRAQNGAYDYLRKALSLRDVPDSFRKFVTNLSASKHGEVSAVVRQSILGYWNSSGERLRDYRVLSQHYVLVPSNVTLWFNDAGSPEIYLALPQDAKARSPLQIRYGNPLVLAYPYCKDTFEALVSWIYELANLIAPEITEASIVVPYFVDGHGQVDGYLVAPPGEFARALHTGIGPQSHPANMGLQMRVR